ncbi:peptidoglycan-binding protein [bacterium]|nr:peptidoglycan-binding protein [bacterium]
MQIEKTTRATASRETRIAARPAPTARPEEAPRERASLSNEPEGPARSPINFGSWASPGRALRRGVEAEPQVRDLQKALNIKADGKFGPQTEQAVRDFQEKHRLKADGLVGKATAEALNAGRQQNSLGSSAPVSGPRPQGPARKVDSFSFSSEPQSPQAVKDLIEKNKAAGKTTMIGIDPNNEPAKQQQIAKIAQANGAQTHKYLEGPGGPTGDGPNPKWERSEYERTRALAAREGIQLPKPPDGQRHFNVDDRNPAMKAWNDQAWQQQAIKQAREAKKEGHSSVEVDNINRDFKGRDNSDEAKAVRAMDFYSKYASQFKNGDMPTLMLKNLSEPELKAVGSAIRDNKLPRAMFSDFSINEYQAKMKPGQERNEMMRDLSSREALTRQLGISPLRSGDTEHYAARS